MPLRFVQANDGYRYILTVVDILTKSAWAVPLRNKTGSSIAAAFNTIFRQSGRHPRKLQTDDGKEFLNVQMRTLLRARDINHFTYNNEEIKAACVERFNRTLKSRMERYLTHNNTRRWIDSLDRIMRSYNNTVHTSIRMTPNDAKSGSRKETEALLNLYKPSTAQLRRLVREREPREQWKQLRVGDTVRISMYRHAFRHKGYEQGWTDEHFIITKIEARTPTVYRIADLQRKPVAGTFYRHELQRVSKPVGRTEYRVERVLRRRYNKQRRRWEALVRWEGWGPEFDSWEDARSVHDL
jgi:hypothetical protein